jgi:Toastrack DUF4097
MNAIDATEIEHTIGDGGLLSIRIRDGRIRLRGIDGAVVRVRDAADRDLSERYSIGRGDGSLSIDVRRHQSSDLEIDLPHAANLVVETVSAEIDATSLVGDQRYRTTSGDLTLRAVTGRIAIDAVSGDAEITATDTLGLEIRTVSGDVELRAATIRDLAATTTSGDIDIAARFDGPGPFRIETVSGDGRLAPGGDLRIETTTLSGDLHSELVGRSDGRRGRRSLIIGDGGPLLTYKSMSGDLSVMRPRKVEAADATDGAIPTSVPTEPHAGSNGAIAAAYEDARLRILRALERGEIDASEAGRRFEALDGPLEVDPASDTIRSPLAGSSDGG